MSYFPASLAREVGNCPQNYEQLARDLRGHRSVLLRWVDDMSTGLDVLLSLPLAVSSTGYRPPEDYLFVSILHSGFGAYGFTREDGAHPWYVGEKLFSGRENPTVYKMAEFIAGVLAALDQAEEAEANGDG